MKIDTLSIVILTNRSDARFEAALKSAQFTDNVFIVDNTSNNNWADLAKKYSFKMLSHTEKISDFSQVRNKALASIQTPWVLFLDSDEVLSADASNEIKTIIEQNFYDAVSIRRIDYFLDKPLQYGETGNLWLTRLFKTNKGKFARAVHEVVEYDGKLGTANFTISHFSHTSVKEFLEKVTKYSYIESKNRTYTQTENTIQMCVFPVAKFVLNYVIKLGFLDGYRGLVYAVMMSLHSFFVRVFYYEKL